MSNQHDPYGWQSYASQRQPLPPQHEPVDNEAMQALGLGIGSILLSCCPVGGAVMGVFAVVKGLNAAQMDNPTNKIMGIVGIVCGGIGVCLSAALLILSLVLGAFNK